MASHSAIAMCCIHAARMLQIADEGELTRESRPKVRAANLGQAALLFEAAQLADELVEVIEDCLEDRGDWSARMSELLTQVRPQGDRTDPSHSQPVA